MSDGTHIEWTDATWNPITGCSVVSPGCANCYAMKLAGTRLKDIPSRQGLTRASKAGPVWTGEVRLNEGWLDQPLRWRRPRRIFVCAHGDLFHESVPDEWIDRVFAVMALAPQHQFQVLTKRSARMLHYMADWAVADGFDRLHRWARANLANARADARPLTVGTAPRLPLPNVWLGVSVEDQARADERIPDLLATPAAVRWISAEPLLGPINLQVSHDWCDLCGGTGMLARWPKGRCHVCNGKGRVAIMGPPKRDSYPRLDWVVVGGESGPGARPMHPDWARSLRDQCADAGVPFLFKQWGEYEADQIGPEDARSISCPPGHVNFRNVGKKAAGRLLDGVLHDGFPA